MKVIIFKGYKNITHFYFILPMYGRESFLVKFGKYTFWWIDTIWGSLNPKITFFKIGLCVCNQHNSKTNKRRNSKHVILHFYQFQMLLEALYGNQSVRLYRETRERIQEIYSKDKISCQSILTYILSQKEIYSPNIFESIP